MGRADFRGFEKELVDAVSELFRFQGVDLRVFKLLPGRNLFYQDLPEPSFIAQGAPPGALPYDEKREPALCFYRQPATRPRPSSSYGGTLEISELVVLRSPAAFQKAMDLLDELGDWLEGNAGRILMPGFKIGSIEIAGAATPFSRGGDGATFASSTLKFLVVSLRR